MQNKKAAQYLHVCFLDSVFLVDIVFIGPVGSGKSSLIGSLYRSVNEEAQFPDRVSLTLNHPDEDTHGTMQWMETSGNPHGTIIYQDTRGDQVCSEYVHYMHYFTPEIET